MDKSDVRRAVGALFVFNLFFPFILVPGSDFETFPLASVLGLIVLTPALFVSGLIGLVLLTVSAFSATFSLFESLGNSFVLLQPVLIYSLAARFKLRISFAYVTALFGLHVFVALNQFFLDPLGLLASAGDQLASVIPRFNQSFRYDDERGVQALASEPSTFAFVIILYLFLSLRFEPKQRLVALALVCAAIALNRSFVLFAFLATAAAILLLHVGRAFSLKVTVLAAVVVVALSSPRVLDIFRAFNQLPFETFLNYSTDTRLAQNLVNLFRVLEMPVLGATSDPSLLLPPKPLSWVLSVLISFGVLAVPIVALVAYLAWRSLSSEKAPAIRSLKLAALLFAAALSPVLLNVLWFVVFYRHLPDKVANKPT